MFGLEYKGEIPAPESSGAGSGQSPQIPRRRPTSGPSPPSSCVDFSSFGSYRPDEFLILCS